MPNEEINQNDNSLYVSKEVDKKDLNYYLGNPITITITIINNSLKPLEDLMIVDEIPEEIVPENGNFKIETSKGDIIQNTNQIKILINRLEINETVIIKISGKVGKI